MLNLWRNSIHLLLELNLFYFCIVLLYLDYGVLPPIAGILIPYVLAIGIYSLLLRKLPKTYAAILVIAPLLIVAAYLLQYNMAFAVIIGFLLSFRSFMYFIEDRIISTFALLILSFIWMPFVYACGVLVDYPQTGFLMGLFAGQLLLVALQYSGNTILSLHGNRTMQKTVLLTTASVFGLIIAAAALFSTVGKWLIVFGFSKFGEAVSFIFHILSTPIFYLLSLHDWTAKSGGPREESPMEWGEEGDRDVAELMETNTFIDPVTIAILLIVGFIILYILLKKKKVAGEKFEGVEQEIFQSTMTTTGGSFFSRRRKPKPPEHQVRKLMYDLERLALKKNRGRLPNETLEEWLRRETSFNDSFMQLYAKVRYGELELTESEMKRCKEIAYEIQKVMKQWKKTS